MNKKSRGSRENRELKARSQAHQNESTALNSKKSSSKSIIIALALIVIIVVGASVALSQPTQDNQSQTGGSSYPRNISPVTYSSAAVSSDGKQVTLPVSEVNSSKLVFVDLKLKTSLDTLEYQGRTVPLTLYRSGEYLPLVIISTPSGNTVAGIRTCEPCGSFSFHIVDGANLKCDVCGAKWTLEDFSPVSGGCATYPPPKLSTAVNGDTVTVDLSALSLQYSA